MEIIYHKKFVKELSRVPQKVRNSVVEIMKQLSLAKTLESSGIDYKLMEGQKRNSDIYKHFPPK